MMTNRQFNPAHPGEVLRHYLDLENSTVQSIADHLKVSRVTLSRLLNGKAGVSPEMAIRLSKALRTSPEMWLDMQAKYDLWLARKTHRRLNIQPLISGANRVA
jgi:addiction module HigA family antidote